MTYFPVPVERFGGLNLGDDPGEVGFSGAINLADVDVDRSGRLRSRDLASTLITGAPAGSVIGWGNNIVASSAAQVRLYDATGSPIAAAQAAPNQFFNGSSQGFGTPAASYFYLADASNVHAIRRLTDGGVLSAPAGMPICSWLSLSTTDNRLVAGFVHGFPHRVQFSNAGDAETWGANDWVDLDPGDGEAITGLQTFAGLLFAFKYTKFYVFYGDSVDSSGNPIFNYRAIRTGIGGQPIGATSRGVYFFDVHQRRIYRSTGGAPVRVSAPIEAALQGIAPSSFTAGNVAGPGIADMVAVGNRIYFTTHMSSGQDVLFVYDEDLDVWLMFRLTSGTQHIASAQANTYLVVADTLGDIYQIAPTNSTENYNAGFTASYQSGFESLAPPRRYIDKYGFGPSRKRVRSWRVAGSGTVTMSVAADEGALKGATSLTLGTSPAIAEARYSNAIRGAKISYKLSGVGPWSVNDLVAMLADTRQPGSDVSDS